MDRNGELFWSGNNVEFEEVLMHFDNRLAVCQNRLWVSAIIMSHKHDLKCFKRLDSGIRDLAEVFCSCIKLAE